jgi:hypothetical protein
MKSKVLILAVALFALVVGFFVGRWHTAASWNRFFEHYVYQRDSNDIQRSTRALTYFRNGKQEDALMVLETHLDGSIITFATYDQVPPEQREDFVPRAIAVAREYRSQHAWKSSNGEVAESVQRTLETVR